MRAGATSSAIPVSGVPRLLVEGRGCYSIAPLRFRNSQEGPARAIKVCRSTSILRFSFERYPSLDTILSKRNESNEKVRRVSRSWIRCSPRKSCPAGYVNLPKNATCTFETIDGFDFVPDVWRVSQRQSSPANPMKESCTGKSFIPIRACSEGSGHTLGRPPIRCLPDCRSLLMMLWMVFLSVGVFTRRFLCSVESIEQSSRGQSISVARDTIGWSSLGTICPSRA